MNAWFQCLHIYCSSPPDSCWHTADLAQGTQFLIISWASDQMQVCNVDHFSISLSYVNTIKNPGATYSGELTLPSLTRRYSPSVVRPWRSDRRSKRGTRTCPPPGGHHWGGEQQASSGQTADCTWCSDPGAHHTGRGSCQIWNWW